MFREHLKDIGWVFIYISAFGLSDYIINKYCISERNKFFYFTMTLLIGIFLIFKNKIFR